MQGSESRERRQGGAGPVFRHAKSSVALSIPPPVRIPSAHLSSKPVDTVSTSRAISRKQPTDAKPKNSIISSRIHRPSRASSSVSKISDEKFWEDCDPLWTDVTFDDIEFAMNLQNMQKDRYEAFLKANFTIRYDESGLPVLEDTTADHPAGLHCFSRRIPPPPPVQTTNVFCGPRSLASALAARGSADEFFWPQCVLAAPYLGVQADDVTGGDNEEGVDAPIAAGEDGPNGTWAPGHQDDERELTRRLVQKFWTHVQFQEECATSAPSSQTAVTASVPSGTVGGQDYAADKTAMFRLRSLGKRGRLYDDVWNEQDFLARDDDAMERCVENWSQLLKYYNDDHDGPYIDWLIEEQLKARRFASARAQERVTSSSSFSGIGTRSTGTVPREPSVRPDTSMFSPPVPVSVQHPACWGPGARFPLQQRCRVDVDVIHPACASATVVHPTGKTLAKLTGNGNAGGLPGYKRRRVQCDSVDQEFDEVGLHADFLVRQLEMQAAANYVLLSRVIACAKRQFAIQQLRQKESQLQSTAVAVLNCIRGFKDTLMEQAMISKLGKEAASSSCNSRKSPKKLTMSAKATKSSPALPLVGGRGVGARAAPTEYTGAALTEHLPSGEFLRDLQVDSLVEVYGTGNVWSLSRVVGLKHDTAGVLRFVQTRPIGACEGDCQVAAVEDGTIVPPGTHIPQFLVEIA